MYKIKVCREDNRPEKRQLRPVACQESGQSVFISPHLLILFSWVVKGGGRYSRVKTGSADWHRPLWVWCWKDTQWEMQLILLHCSSTAKHKRPRAHSKTNMISSNTSHKYFFKVYTCLFRHKKENCDYFIATCKSIQQPLNPNSNP